MGKIFKNQTRLRIQLNVGQDVTGAGSLSIKYKKPNEDEGEWTALPVGDSSNTSIYYSIESGEVNVLDQSGKWMLWSDVLFSDGKQAYGEATVMWVYEEGT